MNWLVVLQLLILSDGVGAFIGSRSAWQMRDAHGRRVSFFVVCAFSLLCYSVSAFGSAYNSIVNGPQHIDYPAGFLIKAIAFRILQTIGIWTFSLRMVGGEGGAIKRIVVRLFHTGEQRPAILSSGELPAEHWDRKFDDLGKKIDELKK
jgi:hypothetical protein